MAIRLTGAYQAPVITFHKLEIHSTAHIPHSLGLTAVGCSPTAGHRLNRPGHGIGQMSQMEYMCLGIGKTPVQEDGL